ncbi:uncharacterized protein E0L32_002101 [Thyridium curvatum]|uniref:Uncharacterized protein n=1 Tax=Thyridium curvatum TaxID=1093900 RepID=A0A507ARJ7_9PEZI|nr:uncharacterized protein E0L32_002032 [Thyridium curvatum]XP_030989209.1 uncharacterized protein E0L32_002101 [Thyridium curvatum]TPX07429.1 hypothetical protein E0L32_002032 [Thyridium curvatum]TPX07498.1 hypothetical protein E0L32_002101 [Thyridium curvatum]
MASSIARFAATPELLMCLADQWKQIHNRKTLLSLSQTSRLFNTVFAVFLYKELTLKVPNTGKFYTLLTPSNLEHVRSLITHPVELYSGGVESGKRNSLLQLLLPHLPQLTTLRWEGLNLTADTVRMIHRHCPQLESLHVKYTGKEIGRFKMPSRPFNGFNHWAWSDSSSNHIQEHHPVFHNPGFESFTGLKELCLYGLFGDLESWCHKIVAIAVSCPQLETLGLSHSCDTQKLTGYYDTMEPVGFFDDICSQYGETGAAPLRLKTLHIGDGGLLRGGIEIMNKLTDVAFLEELGAYDDSEAWCNDQTVEAFTKTKLPRLRRLIMKWMPLELITHLKSDRAEDFSQQLALLALDFPQGALGGVNPAKLRMTSVMLLPSPAVPDDMASRLGELADRCGDVLEGIAFYVGNSPCPARVTKLVLDNLVEVATRLVKLTQIYICFPDGRDQKYSPSDTYLEFDSAYCADLACRLVRAAPRLRYLCIRGVFWEAQKSVDGTVKLIELERQDWRHVELFKMATEGEGLVWDDRDIQKY